MSPDPVMSERWLPVVGYEGLYEISDMGRVWSMERMVRNGPGQRTVKARALKPVSVGKYFVVTLYKNGRRQDRKIHHLVLEAFVGPRPVDLEGCHRNDISDDNQLTNLRWDTRSANALDMSRNGKCHNANKTQCRHRHPYTAETTRLDTKGRRVCLVCRREYDRKRRRSRC